MKLLLFRKTVRQQSIQTFRLAAIEVQIVNKYVHGNIKLTKVDADYPDNKLLGAVFEVYKDKNGNGILDKEGGI